MPSRSRTASEASRLASSDKPSRFGKTAVFEFFANKPILVPFASVFYAALLRAVLGPSRSARPANDTAISLRGDLRTTGSP